MRKNAQHFEFVLPWAIFIGFKILRDLVKTCYFFRMSFSASWCLENGLMCGVTSIESKFTNFLCVLMVYIVPKRRSCAFSHSDEYCCKLYIIKMQCTHTCLSQIAATK